MIDLKKISSTIETQRLGILSKIKRLRKEDPFSANDRSLIVEPGTDASDLFGHEQVVVLENRLKSDLREIEQALAKIKKGTYGICESCKKAIETGRIAVKPAAIFCVKCEKLLEKKRK